MVPLARENTERRDIGNDRHDTACEGLQHGVAAAFVVTAEQKKIRAVVQGFECGVRAAVPAA